MVRFAERAKRTTPFGARKRIPSHPTAKMVPARLLKAWTLTFVWWSAKILGSSLMSNLKDLLIFHDFSLCLTLQFLMFAFKELLQWAGYAFSISQNCGKATFPKKSIGRETNSTVFPRLVVLAVRALSTVSPKTGVSWRAKSPLSLTPRKTVPLWRATRTGLVLKSTCEIPAFYLTITSISESLADRIWHHYVGK